MPVTPGRSPAAPPGGSLATDAELAAQVTALRDETRRPTGAVVIIWDDGYTSSLTAADLAEARDQKLTFAITKNLIGTADHITTAQMQALHAAGHEIADHSVTHTNFVTGLTATQRASELDENLAYLEAQVGAGQISTFVYPFGTTTARNTTTDREIFGRYERMFGVGDPSNVLMPNRWDCPPLIQRLFLETSTYLPRAEDMIRRAARTETVACFYVHRFTEDGGGISVADYTDLIDLAEQLQVPVMRADEAFPARRALCDPGFEDSTLGSWFSVVSGGTAESVADTPDTGLPGSRSLHLVASGGQYAYVTQPYQVRQGVTYTISGRYRTSAGLGSTTLKVRARQYDYGSTDLVDPLTTNLAEATSWTRFSVDISPGTSTAFVMVDLLLLPGSAGEAWIDHVDIRPKHHGSFG